MAKLNNIEFVIRENDHQKLVFRFYPKNSSCHSFNDKPPQTWKDVYKVYYNYRVIILDKKYNERDILFDSGVDECSIIDEVAHRIKLIVSGITVYKGFTKNNIPFSIKLLDNEVFPFGDGISWNITKKPRKAEYIISMFDTNNVGYRFCLTKDKLEEFGKYLESCCEHMLANGVPI